MIKPVLLLVYATVIVICSSEENANKILEFGPGNPAFDYWQKPNFPLTINIYFFNWTNPEDIHNHDIKPKFEEVGPYVYKQYTEKVNVYLNRENQTVTYQNRVNYYFDEENSPRHESDAITTINFPAMAMADATRDWNILFKHSVKFTLTTSQIYVTKTVRELLFEGYEDPISRVKSAIPFLYEKQNDERFGWLHGKNGTAGVDGVYNVAVGRNSDFGALKSWKYESKTPYYEGHCADIKGTNGEFYPENIQPDHIEFFSPEICRSIQLKFEKNVDVGGLQAYQFNIGQELLDNGTLNKENECFCNGECLPSGVFNASTCRGDGPTFISLPHFYLADPIYNSNVEGLNPDKNKHEFYIRIDPITGSVVDFNARGQINVLLRPIDDFPMYEDVPQLMFPVFWFEKTVGAYKPELNETANEI